MWKTPYIHTIIRLLAEKYSEENERVIFLTSWAPLLCLNNFEPVLEQCTARLQRKQKREKKKPDKDVGVFLNDLEQ